jgi:hypothetical protein
LRSEIAEFEDFRGFLALSLLYHSRRKCGQSARQTGRSSLTGRIQSIVATVAK